MPSLTHTSTPSGGHFLKVAATNNFTEGSRRETDD